MEARTYLAVDLKSFYLLQPFKRNRIQMFQKVICDGPLDVGQMLIRISDLLLEICHRTLSFLM